MASSQQGQPVYTLSPSDLTFLLHECERCFYAKVRERKRLPRTPMPAVFTELDRQQRDFFHNKPVSALGAGLPDGILNCHPGALLSAPLFLDDGLPGLIFRGAIDAGIAFRGGGYGVVDFKTTNPYSTHVDMYRHQLHAYAWALENPSAGTAPVGPIRRMGLLCFYPVGMMQLPTGHYAFRTAPTWLEVARENDLFKSLMRHVMKLLSSPLAPEPGSSCPRCNG